MIAAKILVDPERKIGPVDPKLYSGFIEHLGTCIEGGIIPASGVQTPENLVTPSGFRKDVLELIRDELKIPVVRWPGGNFVSSYRWKDGIGAVEKRPKRPELAWGGVESNRFGTDEYIRWCREANVEPYICVNMGTGSLEDALDWLEYCNGTGDTYWANQRRANNGGDPKPHGVKYWGLGNEVYGFWQVGNMTATDYTRKAQQWAHALKLLDPSIIIVSCGQNGFNAWDATVLQGLVKHVDLHSIHFYTSWGERNRKDECEFERKVFGPEAIEYSIDIAKNLIDLARIENGVTGTNPVKIAFDEWGSWDESLGTRENGLKQIFDLTDALAVASWLNVFVRKADVVAMANYAQAVNVIAPIITSPTGLFKQTIYHPLYLFANYMQGDSLDIHIDSPRYSGESLPTWVGEMGKPGRFKWVDASAVVNKEGRIRIVIVNRHKSEPTVVKLKFPGDIAAGEVKVLEVYHDSFIVQNSFEQPENVKVTETSSKRDKGEVVLKPHSISLLLL